MFIVPMALASHTERPGSAPLHAPPGLVQGLLCPTPHPQLGLAYILCPCFHCRMSAPCFLISASLISAANDVWLAFRTEPFTIHALRHHRDSVAPLQHDVGRAGIEHCYSHPRNVARMGTSVNAYGLCCMR